MKRSASIAKEAGVEYEYLATWIALISERTRLSEEMIGTGVQALLARMHQSIFPGRERQRPRENARSFQPPK